MTAMNRNYYFYNESYESAFEQNYECGYEFMRSFEDRQMRDNVVLAKGRME